MISIAEFKKEVLTWAEDIRAQPKEIHVRQMWRKWASCSTKGRLTFSFALLNQSLDVRSKAVVHELLHLKYPNHGKMFKSLLISHLTKKGIDAREVEL
ncbi:MAG: M48 family metallopeptidase [candidate division Zixibacteria bacterium]|nr:M48 family metallopeptidase [candidate division Zixibacteria bacterium]